MLSRLSHVRRGFGPAAGLLPGAILLAATICAPAQNFETASIKLNTSGETAPSGISAAQPGRFEAKNTPLKFVILYAYHLLNHELAGVPDWVENEAFDITAVYPTNTAAGPADVRLMVQHLLKDRFGLVIHTEQRVIPAYDLTLLRKSGELGQNMKASAINCDQLIAEKQPLREAGGSSAVAPNGKRPACSISATRRWLTGGGVTMPQLTATLQSMLAKPVVDHTALEGRFDVEAKWSLLDDTGDAPQGDSPSIFYALREQLGLRLDPHKKPFEVHVIDRITQPTAN
ncbi:MAG TPA: TIGR03435 family protein [Bryobacteraceae bacterium]|nr:TIGR03435 family protein [Bryobacteraceae bacterium]